MVKKSFLGADNVRDNVRDNGDILLFTKTCGLHYENDNKLPKKVEWPGGPGRLPAQGSHRSVLAHIRAYGSSSHGFAALT